MVYLQLFSPYRQIHKWMEKVFVFSPHKWHSSGHAWILNTQYLILGAPQNDKLCFGVFFIMLMMMMTPSENRRPKNEFQGECTTCCWYGVQVKTEWGGDAALARPSLLPSTITKTRSKLFFDLFRISPPTSPNQFIFQDKIMNKNQIEEKQCRGEHGRC